MVLPSRRTLLKSLALSATSIAIPSSAHGRIQTIDSTIKLGIIADTHIGFVDDAGSRFDAFLKEMAGFQPDGLIQLGDFAYPNAKLQPFADKFNDASDFTLHAIGNHDLDHSLTREDCLKAWKIPNAYYSKTIQGLRIIVLDGNEKGSSTHAKHGGYPSYIGPKQQAWLAQELSRSMEPVMIVSHQPLAGRSTIDNASELQSIISEHKDKVLLCMNGHSHVDQRVDIDGIAYVHCNSASYFWLGGKVRLAKYRDPLFAKLTVDLGKKLIRIEGIESEWLDGTPTDANYFTGKNRGLESIVVPEIRDRSIRRASPS